jgi:hypothetical protein
VFVGVALALHLVFPRGTVISRRREVVAYWLLAGLGAVMVLSLIVAVTAFGPRLNSPWEDHVWR